MDPDDSANLSKKHRFPSSILRLLDLDEYEELAAHIRALDSPHGYYPGPGYGHLGPITHRERGQTIFSTYGRF